MYILSDTQLHLCIIFFCMLPFMDKLVHQDAAFCSIGAPGVPPSFCEKPWQAFLSSGPWSFLHCIKNYIQYSSFILFFSILGFLAFVVGRS